MLRHKSGNSTGESCHWSTVECCPKVEMVPFLIFSDLPLPDYNAPFSRISPFIHSNLINEPKTKFHTRVLSLQRNRIFFLISEKKKEERKKLSGTDFKKLYFFCCCFLKWILIVAQSGLKLSTQLRLALSFWIYLLPCPECRNYRHVLHCLKASILSKQ